MALGHPLWTIRDYEEELRKLQKDSALRQCMACGEIAMSQVGVEVLGVNLRMEKEIQLLREELKRERGLVQEIESILARMDIKPDDKSPLSIALNMIKETVKQRKVEL